MTERDRLIEREERWLDYERRCEAEERFLPMEDEMEDWNDQYSRLQQMLFPLAQRVPDLPPSEREAIRWALGMINAMADELAGFRGSAVGSELRRVGEYVQSFQDKETL